MTRARLALAAFAIVAIAIAALALSAPVEAGKVKPLPITCANVLCAPCPPGTVPAPVPKKPKSLADCCRCIPVK